MNTPDWTDAACRDHPDPEIFHLDTFPPELAANMPCHSCPIRVECFNYAWQKGLFGYWGGTSDAQRRTLKEGFTRARCPICGAPSPFRQANTQVCGYCGMSWPARRVKAPSRRDAAA